MVLFEQLDALTHINDFSVELAFTDTYRQHIQEHPAIREAHCLKVQFEHLFDPILPGDLFAGRTHYLPVGFGLEDAAGGPVYYCYDSRILPAGEALPADERQAVLDMVAFWKKEATIAGKLIQRLPAQILKATSNHIAEMMGRLSGTLLDYEKLVRIGLPGLRAEIETAKNKNGDLPLYSAMTMALDILTEVMDRYTGQARSLAGSSRDEMEEREYLEMASVLEAIKAHPPQTLREAAQLTWLYTLISGTVNYGRMDVYLGPFMLPTLTRAASARPMPSA